MTFGHGTLGQDDRLALLLLAGISSVVDVRTAPGSKRHPHVGALSWRSGCPAAGVGYRWEPRLGGFRRAPEDSPDTAWRNASFRGYAAHTRTPPFLAALDGVQADG